MKLEGGGLRASLSKELPQEDVAFIGFAAGGWVDIKSVLSLGFVRTAVCVKPAPLTLRRKKTADTMLCGGHSCLGGNEVGAELLFPTTSS